MRWYMSCIYKFTHFLSNQAMWLKFIKIFSLILIASIINSCSSSNDEKNHFIQKNIKKINNKNINKHGELVIPDFLLEMENGKIVK